MSDSSDNDGVRAPLAKEEHASYTFPEKHENSEENTMAYRASILGTWETFSVMFEKTVWGNPKLWGMLRNLMLLTLVFALIPIALVPDPAVVQVSRLNAVSQFLNVVVGLLLGFFLTSSVNRWYACVNGFLSLLDAIRNLQMQFVALGVPEKEGSQILRTSFASAYLLHQQLMYDHKKLSKDFDEKEALDEMWQTVAAKPALMTRGKYGSQLLEGPEIELLKGVRDPASVIWTWNAAVIGRLAQDGWIPPMPSPTYGRIMNLCQGAHEGIRQVRASICVQTPWNYAHCLASLVHINNAINAVNLGLVSGLVTATLLQRHNVLHYHFKASLEQVEEDIANCLVTVLLCTIGPAVYQALLLISIALAQPFDDDDAKIPMERLLNQLEVDMCDSLELIDKMQTTLDFDPPYFKQPQSP